MSDHGVVAIDTDRLAAFADVLQRVSEDLLRARAEALGLAGRAGVAVPGAVEDLGAASVLLHDLGLDVRRRLAIVRRLPWDAFPWPTSILLGREVEGPSAAAALARGRIGSAASLDRLLAATEDPYEAAAALQVLGVEGFRQLYALVDPEAEGAEDRAEAITALLLRASTTVDRPGGLPRSFVDGYLGLDAPVVEGDGPAPGASTADHVAAALSAAGAGQYLVAATQRAVTGGAAALVVRAGRVIGVVGAVAGLVALEGESAGDVANGIVSGMLGLVGALAGGPVGWVAAGLGLVVSLLACDRGEGTPPRRTYPSDRTPPGGHGTENHLNGAGIPVAPNGV